MQSLVRIQQRPSSTEHTVAVCSAHVLEAQFALSADASSFVRRGRQFRRGPRFRKRMYQAALEYCELCHRMGQIVFLVEDAVYYTAWKHIRTANASSVPATVKPAQCSRPQTINPAPIQPDFVDRCRKALLATIGPIANLIVEETLSKGAVTDASQFAEALSKQIPKPQLVIKFQEELWGQSSPYAAKPQAPRNFSTIQSDISAPVLQEVASSPITPSFVEHCRKALSVTIGPVADSVMNVTLSIADGMDSSEFVQALSSNIAEPHLISKFQQCMMLQPEV